VQNPWRSLRPGSDGGRWSPLGRWVTAGCALWIALLLLVDWPAPLSPGFNSNSAIDAAFFAWGGDVVRHGGTPYLAFWDHKPPLIYFIDAAGLTLARGGVWGIWLLNLGALVGSVALCYVVLRRLLGDVGAAFGTVAFTLSLPAVMPWNLTEAYALPLQWTAILLSLVGAALPRRAFALGLGLGVLGGLSALLRPNLGGAELVAAVLLIWSWRSSARAPRALAGLGLGLVVGGLVSVGPVLAWLASRGALPDFYDQVIRYNRLYTDVGLKQRIRAGYDGIKLAAQTLPLLLPGAGWLLAARRALRGRASAEAGLLLPLALAWPVVETALAAVSGRGYAHYFATLTPPFALLAGYVAVEILAAADSPRGSSSRAVAVVAALAAALVAPRTLDILLMVRDGGLYQRRAAAVAAVAGYVRSHTRPEDRVLVWGHAADVYLFSGRQPVSRFVYPLALLTPRYADSALVAGFLRDVERARPPLIVDATAYAPEGEAIVPHLGVWDPSWQYPPTSYVPGLYRPVWWRMTPALRTFYDYVDRNYTLADSVGPGRWAVYRRR
jgi:4-amino-4-deoxy-L-arabinose transferase-like glycosyltransferase